MSENNDSLAYIGQNINIVRQKVKDAALKSGRDINDIKVIAVTKTLGVDKILSAINYGIIDLGENRVQELCEKYPLLNLECEWHLIGHLQTNKVKYIIGKITMLHSLDRIELAEEIQRKAAIANRKLDVLVQVNVAGEDTKFGIRPQDTRGFVRDLTKFPNLKVRGLMTIAPHVQNPEEVRPIFKELKKIFIDICKENNDNISMDYLSMGMSNDYEVAIEEGANIVRVGTAIFGERQYNI